MALDISGLNFFIPIFSFLFVFIIVYSLLFKTKILGESKFANLLISFIFAIIFMSISSMKLYVETILPWFIVLLVVMFLIFLIAGFSTKDLSKIMTPKLAWVFIGILILIFLVSAVKVFNPIFHPDLIISSGDSGTTFFGQIKSFFSSSKVLGSVLLLIIAGIVAKILTKK